MVKNKKLFDLEEQFKKAIDESTDKIYEQISIAEEAIEKACKISEEYGIPFYANVSPLGQVYRPDSFDKKWGKLLDDEDTIYEYLENGIGEYEGWQHSSVC